MNVSEGHERWRDELAVYALGALEPGEAAAIEQHLADCSDCSAAYRRLLPVVESIPEGVEQLQPPPEMRDRVMAIVSEDAAEDTAGRLAADESGRVAARSRGRGGRAGFLLRPASAVVVGAIAAAGIVGYTLHGDQERTATIAALRADGAGGASAALVRKGDSGTLRISMMPRLRGNNVYGAWVRRGGTVERASLFVPGRDGSAAAAIPQGLNGAEEVIVTREPKGGGKAPARVLLRAPLE